MPLFIIVLSALNQLIRVHLLRTVMLPAERALLTTLYVDRGLKRMRKWNWTSVLRKVHRRHSNGGPLPRAAGTRAC